MCLYMIFADKTSGCAVKSALLCLPVRATFHNCCHKEDVATFILQEQTLFAPFHLSSYFVVGGGGGGGGGGCFLNEITL